MEFSFRWISLLFSLLLSLFLSLFVLSTENFIVGEIISKLMWQIFYVKQFFLIH